MNGQAAASPHPPRRPKSAAVVLDNLTFRYPGGKAGIFDLSLTIAPGELAVCIGPSGCGKTTLLKLIAGFLRPDNGRVMLGDADVTAAPVRDRQCGIVFQSYALFPHMTVLENISYPLRVRDVPAGARRRRGEELLALVGLQGMGPRLPAQLSGGQQQRVALARALAFEPRALLLDEPLSALDAATRVTMREELRRIQKSQNIAALLITHDQDEALSLADRVAVLRDGRLVQYAEPRAIYDKPADSFVADFVGRANLIDAVALEAEALDTSLGRLAAAHGARAGARLRLLVRPERVEPVQQADGENVFAVEVLRDRFFGASRRIELAVGKGRLEIETAVRGAVSFVRIPRDAIQFLAP